MDYNGNTVLDLKYDYIKIIDKGFIIKEKFNSDIAEKFFDVKRINKLLEDHKSGKKDCYKKVWNIYTFIVWYDEYFVKNVSTSLKKLDTDYDKFFEYFNFK